MKDLPKAEPSPSRKLRAGQSDLLRYSTNSLWRYRSSATAAKLWEARAPFESAMLAVLHSSAQPSEVVSQLATCYTVSRNVATIPKELAGPITELVTAHLASHPDDADALFVLANLQEAAMGAVWVMQQLDTCIQMDPNQAACFALRGKLQLDMREVKNAIADFQCALEFNPHDYDCLYLLGLSWARLTPHNSAASSNAQRALRSFLEAAPKDHEHVASAYYELAALRRLAEDMCAVKELFEKGRAAERERLPLFRHLQSETRDMLAAELAAQDAVALKGCRSRAGRASSDRLRDATYHALTTALLIVG